MNGYIINPAWFYWVNVVNCLRIVALASTIVGIFACIFFIVAVLEEDDKFLKPLRIAIAYTAICIIATVFIPPKETLIEMQIAKYATWENAEWMVDAIKDAVDYIVDAIGSIR